MMPSLYKFSLQQPRCLGCHQESVLGEIAKQAILNVIEDNLTVLIRDSTEVDKSVIQQVLQDKHRFMGTMI